jgi:hypothetical protein
MKIELFEYARSCPYPYSTFPLSTSLRMAKASERFHLFALAKPSIIF